jgi:hypothetical protein
MDGKGCYGGQLLLWKSVVAKGNKNWNKVIP